MITPASPTGPEGTAVLRAYFADILGRANGRAATPAEVDEVVRAVPSDDLVPPTGLFLLARDAGGAVLGCAGLRLLPDSVGEVSRLFVVPPARGAGLGRRLLAAVEDAARSSGVVMLRLDTRDDMVAARGLYASAGYREVAPFNDTPYVDHWFEKSLG